MGMDVMSKYFDQYTPRIPILGTKLIVGGDPMPKGIVKLFKKFRVNWVAEANFDTVESMCSVSFSISAGARSK